MRFFVVHITLFNKLCLLTPEEEAGGDFLIVPVSPIPSPIWMTEMREVGTDRARGRKRDREEGNMTVFVHNNINKVSCIVQC